MVYKPPIFLIGHFRSGTTILWNTFSNSSYFTAYYEPLHPHLLTLIPSKNTKASHRNVKDYWFDYRQHTELIKNLHSVDFATERLFLAEKESWEELEIYLRTLIKIRKTNSQAVLGLNRVGLRIKWLRKTFPDALILGICRESRQQYMSLREHIPDPYHLDAWYPDAYEHPFWLAELIPYFPFLYENRSAHPYYSIYLILRLIREQLQENADYIFDITENVQKRPESFLQTLSTFLNLPRKAFNQKEKDIVQTSPYVIPEEENRLLASIEQNIEDKLALSSASILKGITKPTQSNALREQMYLTKKHLKYTLDYQRQLTEVNK